MSGFFEELQRRKVYRVAAAYIIAAGFIIQIGSAVFPAWELPNWTLRLVVVFLLVGFPIALILAWAYDVTPQGIRATPGLPEHTVAAIYNADCDQALSSLLERVFSSCPGHRGGRSTSRLPSCPSKISAMKRRTLTSPTACRTIS